MVAMFKIWHERFFFRGPTLGLSNSKRNESSRGETTFDPHLLKFIASPRLIQILQIINNYLYGSSVVDLDPHVAVPSHIRPSGVAIPTACSPDFLVARLQSSFCFAIWRYGYVENGWVTSIFLAIFMRKLHFGTLLWTTDGSNGVLWVLILTGAS